jgi:hypothetical protein
MVRLLSGQSVFISSYSNESDPRDEFTELIVNDDNVDMRGYSLRDNNSSTSSWQTAVNFNNTAYWAHLRRGPVIVIHHRGCNSSGVAYTIDSSKADGYIEVSATDGTFFNGGNFPGSPCTSSSGNSLNVAATGDLLQLRDAGGNHIHALGNDNSAGSSWTTDITGSNLKALMHTANSSSGDEIVVCSGDSAARYYGSCSSNCYESGTAKTAISSTITMGLPNSCSSSSTANSNFWKNLREPDWVSPVLSIKRGVGFLYDTLTWNKATDNYSTDSTEGYIILRNTSNTFTAPADGTTYTNGATIGSAMVVTHIKSSQITSYVDTYTLQCGQTVYYRIYAYRYSTDQFNGNTYNAARGRAYETVNFGAASLSRQPKPVTSLVKHY